MDVVDDGRLEIGEEQVQMAKFSDEEEEVEERRTF